MLCFIPGSNYPVSRGPLMCFDCDASHWASDHCWIQVYRPTVFGRLIGWKLWPRFCPHTTLGAAPPYVQPRPPYRRTSPSLLHFSCSYLWLRNSGTEISVCSFFRFFKVRTIFLGPLSCSLPKAQITSIYFQKSPSHVFPHLGHLVSFKTDASYLVLSMWVFML